MTVDSKRGMRTIHQMAASGMKTTGEMLDMYADDDMSLFEVYTAIIDALDMEEMGYAQERRMELSKIVSSMLYDYLLVFDYQVEMD